VSRIGDMRGFWNQRAREDPFYFVDNRLDYGDPDMERFWDTGVRGVDFTLEATGVSIAPDDVVVEVGCGIGRLTRVLAARAREVLALDVSPEMLELARTHNPELGNVRWLLGDGGSLSGVDDASVDGCFSLVVFQHIPDPEVVLAYVREFGRVLRPGGWASFQVSNDPDVHRPSFPVRARAAVASRLRLGPRGLTDPEWLGTAVELDRLREAAEQSGLSVERVVGEGTQYCLVGARRLER
jgi:SAM-dependent methyltransferase